MDRHEKQIILLNCNDIPVEALDQYISNRVFEIKEFESHRLSADKLKELRRLADIRSGVLQDEPTVATLSATPALPDKPKATPVAPTPIEKILNGELSLQEIDFLLKERKLSFEDLETGGVLQKAINSIKYFNTKKGISKFYNITDLAPMEEGRTDVYMVGMAASGKSTMLAGMFKYADDNAVFIPDTYNQEGNTYMGQLKRDLDYGVLPMGTVKGSYNYIATSFKDQKGTKHPFNIVEVPGENYARMFSEGIKSETEYIKGFVNYIKNKNKKILVFVIDVIAEIEKFTNPEHFNALDQSIAYNNILAMFRDHRILDRTDAIYFVVNKFDALKKDRYLFDERPDEELALEFLEQNFSSLLAACKDARERARNKFKIKALPFSIGDVVNEKILLEYKGDHAKVLVNNLLEDSFVVSGGAFWKFRF
ncbi:hypothetical protein FAZ19_09885 [Sphingobacterium alkalisoli]|uniref:Uncharacterized protein n=1 Tax=Sphingobacterium alkalisoli TaxID=1874115 RepID=A0A4U0H1W5_9SPHI|nr:hypothetical protein [Sphingobacterium alkalisoli]TJY65446.1 hypothetical protein FAZ19_09885 [Sphingobacterium alkalisoli]GGH20415.1 hypothetical protein GCM10011418_25590 [Sphingobacterium alkalisoli]